MKLGELVKNPKGFKITGIYRISRFEVKTARNGKAYGDCLISDHSFEVPAKYWDIPTERVALFQKNGVLRIDATLDYFKDSPQLTIESVFLPLPAEVDQSLSSLGMMAPRPIDDMYVELKSIIANVGHEGLRKLLTGIFVDDRQFAEKFKRHPGAVKNHHAYIGGLLEHTLEVAVGALDYCKRNDKIKRDILLAAALVHDIGKVREIEVDMLGMGIGFTREGKLLRHISLGLEMLESACQSVGLEAEISLMLKHCILSHHGQAEWGSPVEPMFLEAELLHYLDNLSAKTEQFYREAERAEPGGFNKSATLRREIYRPGWE
ncbi:3'-5' exoribonuclease YhaM family protein [Sporomusa acidovorans]|uniref:3'-5' exoribonuclease YhaM n=1 Tax=Sporomusa acidovorans (strain ATCC 49682 / DSM 3132 / Mol) TaxID=1123286 RepID=A0ABZ3JBX4_SPOA4|nr:HD domain-containing protein [Sporomusa acidovorans]OZC13303.1 3'-5' exoribonuclease YhaM [Sporomusa acidovorans DSM 3132]SDD97480.1 3'-5' exoribonuclease [Sporomusa acidovorans]